MTMVAGPQLFHSWYTWVKPVIRAAAGTGHGVTVGDGAAVGLGTTSAVAGAESASAVTGWGGGMVGSCGGNYCRRGHVASDEIGGRVRRGNGRQDRDRIDRQGQRLQRFRQTHGVTRGELAHHGRQNADRYNSRHDEGEEQEEPVSSHEFIRAKVK